MHWPDPAQRPHIAEAEQQGWLGEVEGLTISLTGANGKLAQIDRKRPGAVNLGTQARGHPKQDR
jgi:hypothetical protein